MLTVKMWLRRNWPIVVLCSFFFAGIGGAAFFWPKNYANLGGVGTEKSQIESAQDRAAVVVADYTEVLAWFTGVLAFISLVAGCFTWSQIRLARDEFNATHRPRIRVRNINVKTSGPPAWPHAGIIHPSPGEKFNGQFYIANVGDAPAFVKEIYLTFWTSKSGLPMGRPYEGRDGQLIPWHREIAPGSSTTVLFDEPFISADETTDSFVLESEQTIYAMGWIEYQDTDKRVRRTAFCRPFDAKSKRFMRLNYEDPDYEHED